ncbi:MAG: hypothetical protein IT436_14170 [Phycisphaerales bacterium]|nr:hypothetical protein [Phycisphaerales bacterium]
MQWMPLTLSTVATCLVAAAASARQPHMQVPGGTADAGTRDIRKLCDPRWADGKFPLPGVDGNVNTFSVWDPDGAGPAPPVLVAGGSFMSAGGVRVTFIAAWDGTRWSSLSARLNSTVGDVSALTTYDPDGTGPAPPVLVAGGDFTSLGGVGASRIAAWDGTRGSPLGTGMDGSVSYLTTYDPDGSGPALPLLVAGGWFFTAGGVGASCIAAWDGTRWSALGTGMNGPVNCLTTYDPDGAGPAPPVLVAGGWFTSAGGVVAPYIAAWNGTRWSPLGAGMNNEVRTLTTYDPDTSGPAPPVLVAGGRFTSAGGTAANYIAAWDGTRWSPPGTGMNYEVGAVTTYDSDNGPAPPVLVAGGRFTSAGGTAANYIAAWDGTRWSPLGAGMNDRVDALTTYDPDGAGPAPPVLIAGGWFFTAGGVGASRIAAWDGTCWSPLGAGLNSLLLALTTYDPDGAGPAPRALVVGGSFTAAGDVGASRIAAWDGTRWSPLGTGVNNEVRALTTYDPDKAGPAPPVLVAGGRFTSSGGMEATRIAAWDGTRWSPLGAGVNGFYVDALTTYDPDGAGPAPPVLVAGGLFAAAGGVTARNIAAWDGTRWSPLSTGIDNDVYALTTYDPDGTGPAPPLLVAGGYFNTAGGAAANHIAAWDGARWSPVGTGFDSAVDALTTYDPDGAGPAPSVLIAGGGFAAAGGAAANYIAAWDGTRWSPLGTGMSNGVLALTTYDPDGAGPAPPLLVAGGYFSTAGGVKVNFIAAWDGTRWSPLGTGMDEISGAASEVHALTTYDPDGAGPALDSLFAGGDFLRVGGGVSAYIAEWYRPLPCPPGSQSPWPNQVDAPCPADFDHNGVVDVLDLIEFLDRFDAGDPSADLNGDGRLDQFDFLEMTNAISAGCP